MVVCVIFSAELEMSFASLVISVSNFFERFISFVSLLASFIPYRLSMRLVMTSVAKFFSFLLLSAKVPVKADKFIYIFIFSFLPGSPFFYDFYYNSLFFMLIYLIHSLYIMLLIISFEGDSVKLLKSISSIFSYYCNF